MEELAEIIPQESVLTVFTTPRGVDPYLKTLRGEIEAFSGDISTEKGRKAIASFAYKIAKFKTRLDDIGKDLADKQKEIPKKIDAERKYVRETLDSWKDEVRKPLTEWEEAEAARIKGHEQRLISMASLCVELGSLDSAALRERLSKIEAVEIGEYLQEFMAKTSMQKASSIKILTEALAVAEKREQEAIELAKLRKEAAEREQREREERIAKEAAERAKREAEEAAERKAKEAERLVAQEKAEAARKAQAETDAAAARERALQEAADKAERDRLAAEQRAAKAAEDERTRIAKEQAEKESREKAETERREANKAHRGRINKAALDAFVAGGLSAEAAKLAVELIAKKSIPAVSITY